jgi:hypothetical protein
MPALQSLSSDAIQASTFYVRSTRPWHHVSCWQRLDIGKDLARNYGGGKTIGGFTPKQFSGLKPKQKGDPGLVSPLIDWPLRRSAHCNFQSALHQWRVPT